MQNNEAVNLTALQHFILSYRFVHIFNVVLHHPKHHGMPRQFLVAGIGNVITFSPIAYSVHVDVDKSNAVVTFCAK